MSTQTQDETDPQRVQIDHSPSKLSAIVATVAAAIAAATSAPFQVLTLPLGLSRIAAVAAGLWVTESRTWVSIGAASLILSILLSGSLGTPTELLLISMVATVVAWDVGQNAISLGEQMGRHSTTRRNEIIHGSASAVVSLAAGGLAYVIYLTASGGQPVAALSMMALGLVFMIWAIRA